MSSRRSKHSLMPEDRIPSSGSERGPFTKCERDKMTEPGSLIIRGNNRCISLRLFDESGLIAGIEI